MMKRSCRLLAGVSALAWFVAAVGVAPADTGAPKYTLRYKFHPGETLRWEVVHRAKMRTTVSGTTQTAETFSKSVKAWRLGDVKADGSATFQHLVESVDMRQKLSGCQEVRYNSRTDEKPPVGFEQLAQSVGVPLSIVTISAQGEVLNRQRKQLKAAAKSGGPMTIPLPKEPVPVGHRWSFPHVVDVKLNSGMIKKVKTQQTFTLERVKSGVATIRVATQILTPIDDPALESQLIEREGSGTVRFDVDAGRVIEQRMDLDKHVVGFRGNASSLHYVTRFTERLLPAATRTAARPAAKHE